VKSRYVSFFMESEQTADIQESIDETLLPALTDLPNFVGLVVLQTGSGRRREVVALSLWEDELSESDATSENLLARFRLAGFRPSVHEFDILRVVMRDTDGNICLDSGEYTPDAAS
jgi:hypothetical protein